MNACREIRIEITFICSYIYIFLSFFFLCKPDNYISYFTRCAREVSWTLPILMMACGCVERKFEFIQSQRWWFTSHNLFSEFTLKVSTILRSRLGVLKIEFPHWILAFTCLVYWKKRRPALSYHCGHCTLILCASTQEPRIQLWVALTRFMVTLLFT